MEKVSVIIPVYNGEKYIKRCIDSIINQTYKDIEIIIVNDGSTDNTKEILKEYKGLKNVILINKKNKGVSNSRNVGLSKASGKYIMFCDADDWLDKNAVKIAVREMTDKVDALRFSRYDVIGKMVNKKSNSDDVYENINIKEEKNTDLISNLTINKTDGHVTNYLYKKEIIKDNNLAFDEELFYQEDTVFLLSYLLKCKKIKVISNGLYYYFKNADSVTQNIKSSIRNLSSIGNIRKKMLEVLTSEHIEGLENNVEQKFLNLQLMYYLDYSKKMSKKKYFNYIRKVSDGSQEYYNEVLSENRISKKWKIFIKLLKEKKVILFDMYIKLYKLKQVVIK